jgi:hypothetical protein
VSKIEQFPPRPMPNYYTRHGAALLAQEIISAWIRLGHRNVTAEPFRISDGLGWGVRSNLVNGLPPVHVNMRGRHSNGKVKLTPRVVS